MYKNIRTGGVLLVMCSTMLVGCASLWGNGKDESNADSQPLSNNSPSVMDNINSALSEGRSSGANDQLPSGVLDALLPPADIGLSAGEAEAVEPRFDVAVNRVNARTFFLSLVKDTPYNIVVHPDVKGSITLNLKDVTISEVMQMVHNMYGYAYEKNKNGFTVRTNKIQSKLFKINYLNVSRHGESETRVSSGQLTETSNSSSNDNTGSSRESSTSSVAAGSNIKTSSSSNFWLELKESTMAIIGEGEGRSVVVSPQSGLIVVRAYPDELRAVQEYLESAQNIMQRQVILEAKVIEVELKDGYQQGINWASISNSGKTLTGQTGGGSILDNGVSSLKDNSAGNLDPLNFTQFAGNTVNSFGGMFSLAVNSGDFRAFFEFLETQGNMQVLSSPRISTVNNQKAVIKVGSDEFFVTDVSSSTTSGASSTTTAPDVTLTPFFSGIALDVTPQIDEDGGIILHIHPTISEVVDQEKTIDITSQVLRLPLAFSQVRESDSIVHAKNGQIVVIGGLMKNKIVETESSTPILSAIPFIGELFKHKKESTVKSELVILLRPRVIDSDESWSNVIDGSSNRIKQIYHDYNGN